MGCFLSRAWKLRSISEVLNCSAALSEDELAGVVVELPVE